MIISYHIIQNKAYLVQWNLKTNSTITVQIQKHQNDKMQMFIYPKSKLICICRTFRKSQRKYSPRMRGTIIDEDRIQIYHLAYYKYPFYTEEQKPIHTFTTQATKQQKLTNYNICKLNNKSMVGWYSKQLFSSQYTQIITYSLDQQLNIDTQGKQSRKTYKFQNNFNLYPNICGVRILDVWEIKDKVFYIQVQTQFEILKRRYIGQEHQPVYKKQEEQILKHQFPYTQFLPQLQKVYSFIWNYTLNKIRPTSYTINSPHLIQFIGQFRKQKRNYTMKLDLYQRQMSMLTEYMADYKEILLPVGFVDVDTQVQQKLVCLEKEEEDNSYNRKTDLHATVYNPTSYYYICLSYRDQQQKNKQKEQIFNEWNSNYHEEYQQNQQVFQNQKKVQPLKIEKRLEIPGQYSSYELFVNVKQRKIQYFRYTMSQVVTWMLQNIIQKCDQDLIYYACTLVDSVK